MTRTTRLLHALLGLLFCLPLAAQAHEIPGNVRVDVLVQPVDGEVRVLLRVPLAAMRDVDFASRGPGYLDLGRVAGQLEEAARLWLLGDFALYADGEVLAPPALDAVRVALPDDAAFADPGSAYAAVLSRRLPESVNVYWEQALLDVALTYANPAGPQARFQVEPTFARLGISTLTRIVFVPTDGGPRVLTLAGDPGRLSLDPGSGEVFGRFLGNGAAHVLDGMDHLLFLLALAIPLQRIRSLVVVVTAFTLAHSLTLGAAALGLVPAGLWFPPLVEMLIAATIFYMAIENLFQPSFQRRWLVAFGFGLVHGFGFSFALRESLQLAGDHLLTSLAAFNIGIELGQIAVLLVTVPVLRVLGRRLPQRIPAIVISALVAHTAWHWLLERWETFAAYEIVLPPVDAALAAAAMRWMMLLLSAVLVVWLVRGPFERWAAAAEERRTPAPILPNRGGR